MYVQKNNYNKPKTIKVPFYFKKKTKSLRNTDCVHQKNLIIFFLKNLF